MTIGSPSGPALERLGEWPDHADLGVLAVDDGGHILAANARALELVRRDEIDVLGQDQHELLHRAEDGGALPRARCPIMHALLSDRPVQGGTVWFERGDGTLLPVAWTAAPCVWEPGTAGMTVIFHEAAAEQVGRPSPSLAELERLALLAETTSTLTSTLNEQECVARLVELVVPRLADWVVVDLADEQGEIWRTAVVQHQEGRLVHRDDLEGPMPPVSPRSQMPLSRALRGTAASVTGPEVYEGAPDSGIAVVQRELFAATGMRSAAIAPIRGPREVLGALTLGRTAADARFDVRDLSLLEDITRRAGLALSNSRLYQQQRRVAETMQRHLLPQLPRIPGLQMAVRYLAAPHASQVGGDWYDAFTLPDRSTALVIGDVAGHDLDAAAGMAQVRNMLRALAWSHQEPPGAIVDRLDRAMTHISDATMATLILARVQRGDDGTWRLRWTNAGHPPPLLVTHDGRARYLDSGKVLLLGTGTAFTRGDTTEPLPPGATLLLYTDGLIESPAHGTDPGMALLRRHAAALAHRPLDAFCDLLLERARPHDNSDDVALLALRTPEA
ncbi:SpoIIE family protein phosphatase [Streptacidiphilus carbonis]|uniref:SpoIIE family protein phosphatase n=1 Tax=Streptacidiphilus carbonis TaxID=105422 RepID=UPI0006949708|nr:SpoIIE family protein phosphatase [Streptacidiphilus carbonis]